MRAPWNQLVFVLALASLNLDIDSARAAEKADDVRSKVKDAAESKGQDRGIDPDKSVYGIPFGISEDEFIAARGKPMGYARLSTDCTAMICDAWHAFIFEKGVFSGVCISYPILNWNLINMGGATPYTSPRWRLNNGIESEMTLKEVRKILGEKLSGQSYRCHYVTDTARVELEFCHRTDEGDEGDAYHLNGILVRHGSTEPFPGSMRLGADFGGVGIVLGGGEAKQSLRIIDVILGSPAEKADIHPGTVLLSVDGAATSGKTMAECVKLMRGEPGTKVTLEVLDPVAHATNKVTVTRAIIGIQDGKTRKPSR